MSLDIQDNGPGVPERVQAELFQEKTHRLGSETTGLGLVIAWELVHINGGELLLVNTGPRGTRFRITLPSG